MNWKNPTIYELSKYVHGIAFEKVWYDPPPSWIATKNNLRCELAEAWEEYRCGNMEMYWTTQTGEYAGILIDVIPADVYDPVRIAGKDCLKPEGFWVELSGDFCIRALDCFAYRGGVSRLDGKLILNFDHDGILNLPIGERLEGTLGVVAVAIMNGANILRVHDVKECKRVCDMVHAIKNPYLKS